MWKIKFATQKKKAEVKVHKLNAAIEPIAKKKWKEKTVERKNKVPWDSQQQNCKIRRKGDKRPTSIAPRRR
jgi:hypothetical protein